MLASLPLLASCAGAKRSGELYLHQENKQWESILGCKAEEFKVVAKKDRSIPAYLERKYLYAKCGSYFVYGDFKQSLILNMDTAQGVRMERTTHKRVGVIPFMEDTEVADRTEVYFIEIPKERITADFLNKFTASHFDEDELIWLLDQATWIGQMRVGKERDKDKAARDNTIWVSSELTHLFYAAYVYPEAVKNEWHIAKAIGRGGDEGQRKTFENAKTRKLTADFTDWDTSVYLNPLSLLSNIQKNYEADPSKLEELVRVVSTSSGALYNAWLKALEVEK